MSGSPVGPLRSQWLSFCLPLLLFIAGLIGLATIVRPARSATLQDLLNGGILNVANSRFSDWQLLSLTSTAVSLPDLAQVTVVPLAGNPSLPAIQFLPNGQWSISGINSIDLSFKFRVDAIPGSNSFASQALALTAVNIGASGGIAHVSAEVADRAGADLGPTVVIADQESGVFQLASESAFAPHMQSFVVMNVFVTGLTAADTVNLATLNYGLRQTGPPGIPGDYNENGAVDAADYTFWRDNLGSTASLPNDDTAGVAADDYTRWKTNFGASTGSAAANTTSVPEPPSAVIWFTALGLAILALRIERACRF